MVETINLRYREYRTTFFVLLVAERYCMEPDIELSPNAASPQQKGAHHARLRLLTNPIILVGFVFGMRISAFVGDEVAESLISVELVDVGR